MSENRLPLQISGLEDVLRTVDRSTQGPVVLIGSFARGVPTPRSDVDLLVVSQRPLRWKTHSSSFHIQFIPRETFLQRLEAGDDFVAWCARFGISLRNRAEWESLTQIATAEAWPDWRKKLLHALRRLFLSNKLHKLGDTQAAAEELLYAASHCARGLLLRERRFPLSRPELRSQLPDIGYPHLALLIANLSDSPNKQTITQGIRYIKKLLVHLDKSVYESEIAARKSKAATKSTRLRISAFHKSPRSREDLAQQQRRTSSNTRVCTSSGQNP